MSFTSCNFYDRQKFLCYKISYCYKNNFLFFSSETLSRAGWLKEEKHQNWEDFRMPCLKLYKIIHNSALSKKNSLSLLTGHPNSWHRVTLSIRTFRAIAKGWNPNEIVIKSSEIQFLLQKEVRQLCIWAMLEQNSATVLRYINSYIIFPKKILKEIEHYYIIKIKTEIESIVPFLFMCSWKAPVDVIKPPPTAGEFHFVTGWSSFLGRFFTFHLLSLRRLLYTILELSFLSIQWEMVLASPAKRALNL